MKTYIFDIINRYKRWNAQLDMKTKLCNKSWCVFNDNGENEKLIFLENGTLVSSNNGIAIQGNWQFIPSTQSLVILYNNQGYMTHPVFGDNSMLILQLDGSNVCSFLIDENNMTSFLPTSLGDIQKYIMKGADTQNNSQFSQPSSRVISYDGNTLNMDPPSIKVPKDFDKLSGNEDNSLNIPTTVYCTDAHLISFWNVIIYAIKNYHFKKFSGTILSPDGKTAKLNVVNGKSTTMEIYHSNDKLAALIQMDDTVWDEIKSIKAYNTYGIRIDEDTFFNKFASRYEKQIDALIGFKVYGMMGHRI